MEWKVKQSVSEHHILLQLYGKADTLRKQLRCRSHPDGIVTTLHPFAVLQNRLHLPRLRVSDTRIVSGLDQCSVTTASVVGELKSRRLKTLRNSLVLDAILEPSELIET